MHDDMVFRKKINMYSCSHFFFDLFQNLTSVIVLVAVDCMTLVVTSSILRICQLSHSKVFIGVELCVCS
jgi:hypothetical protein